MTENEAIKALKTDSCYECSYGTDSAVNCKYGACRVATATRMAIQALEENQQYHAIGTIEEFKALKEKAKPKKPEEVGKFDNLVVGMCSVCEEGVNSQMNYCDKCGTKLDWS